MLRHSVATRHPVAAAAVPGAPSLSAYVGTRFWRGNRLAFVEPPVAVFCHDDRSLNSVSYFQHLASPTANIRDRTICSLLKLVLKLALTYVTSTMNAKINSFFFFKRGKRVQEIIGGN